MPLKIHYKEKKGRRLNRYRILQVFQCRECLHKFTAAAGKLLIASLFYLYFFTPSKDSRVKKALTVFAGKRI